MRVATRLALGFGTLLAVLFGLLLYQLSVIHEAVRTSRELSEISARLSLTSTDQLGRLDRLEENASKYVVTLEPGYAERYDETREAFDRSVHRLRGLPLTGGEREEVARLSAAWDRYVRGSPSLEARALQATLGEVTEPLAEIAQEADGLREATRRVARASQQAMSASVRQSAAAARRAERISWIAAAAALAIGFLVAWRIVRSISVSVGRLKEGTRKVAEGDFSYRLHQEREDEFAEVSRDFNIMTERLGELDRAKRDFLSQVSHDLKTPLASMQETNRLLLEGLAGPLSEKQQELIELNLLSARRLSAMIAKLLDLARMDAGALEYDFRRQDVGPLVRLIVEEYAPRAAERGVALRARLPEERLEIECDADRFLQVVANLVENAIKFSPAGEPVEVALQREGERALLTVRDRGPGVPDEDKTRIFERFHQGRNGRGFARGVGLGLALCKEIVAAHRGEIRVEDGRGGGSRFQVCWPAARPARTRAARPMVVADGR